MIEIDAGNGTTHPSGAASVPTPIDRITYSSCESQMTSPSAAIISIHHSPKKPRCGRAATARAKVGLSIGSSYRDVTGTRIAPRSFNISIKAGVSLAVSTTVNV
jgi:hypothetical protein